MDKSIFTKEYSLFLELLRRAREDKGLTQADLAERLEETQSFISKVERGERRIDIVELRAFCQAIGIGFSTFISRIDKALNALR